MPLYYIRARIPAAAFFQGYSHRHCAFAQASHGVKIKKAEIKPAGIKNRKIVFMGRSLLYGGAGKTAGRNGNRL